MVEGRDSEGAAAPLWVLLLYVAGMTPADRRALENLRRICDEHLEGRFSLEVLDLKEDPALGDADQIFAAPTVVRREPQPLKKIVGDLSHRERALAALDLAAAL